MTSPTSPRSSFSSSNNDNSITSDSSSISDPNDIEYLINEDLETRSSATTPRGSRDFRSSSSDWNYESSSETSETSSVLEELETSGPSLYKKGLTLLAGIGIGAGIGAVIGAIPGAILGGIIGFAIALIIIGYQKNIQVAPEAYPPEKTKIITEINDIIYDLETQIAIINAKFPPTTPVEHGFMDSTKEVLSESEKTSLNQKLKTLRKDLSKWNNLLKEVKKTHVGDFVFSENLWNRQIDQYWEPRRIGGQIDERNQ